jgi:hypothetical protein
LIYNAKHNYSFSKHTLMRFVILEHTGSATYKPGQHWDLLLEGTEGLRTWQVPCDWREMPRQIVQELPLHRAEYLEYEGPLTGDRGIVRRIARGSYHVLKESTTCLKYDLQSDTFSGTITLTRCDQDWTLAWQAHESV